MASHSPIKQTHQTKFNEYQFTSTLYTYDDIHIDIENTITKHKYSFVKTAKDILELTQRSKFEMDPEQLYNLYLIAISQKTENVKMITSLNIMGDLVLTVNWTITHEEMKMTRTFELTCTKVVQTDAERMEKMFTDFVKQKEKLEQTVEDIKKLDTNKKFIDVYDYINSESTALSTRLLKRTDNVIETLKERTNSAMENFNIRNDIKIENLKTEVNDALSDAVACLNPSNVVNVTVFSDYYSPNNDTVFSICVNKKMSLSKLLITSNIILNGFVSVDTQQWSYIGKSCTNITTPLGYHYSPNDTHPRMPLICMSIIEDHTETGPQTLSLKLPNAKLQHAPLYCVVKVEEIM